MSIEMEHKSLENDEISTTIALRLSQIHQQLLKQHDDIEKITQKLTEINLSENNDENCNDNSLVVTKKLSKLLYFTFVSLFVYNVLKNKKYIFIFGMKPTFTLK